MIRRLLPLFLCLVIGCLPAQAQQLPEVLPGDSLLVIPKPVLPGLTSGELAEMPVVDFPPGAKILTWWPGQKYHYNMPNMIKPKSPVKKMMGEIPEMEHLGK